MNRPRITAAAACAAVVAFAALATPAHAANGASSSATTSYVDVADYCKDAQEQLAGLKPGSIAWTVTYYDSRVTDRNAPNGQRAFSRAKVDIVNATIRQMNVYDADGDIIQVMCKTERQAGVVAEFGSGVVRGAERECSDINATILRRAFNGLSPAQRPLASSARDNAVVEATVYDEFGGLLWSNVGAFATITRDSTDAIHLRSDSLVTPEDGTTAISDAFVDLLNASFGTSLPYGTTYNDLIAMGFVNPAELGVRYCTTPTVDAVAAALLAG